MTKYLKQNGHTSVKKKPDNYNNAITPLPLSTHNANDLPIKTNVRESYVRNDRFHERVNNESKLKSTVSGDGQYNGGDGQYNNSHRNSELLQQPNDVQDDRSTDGDKLFQETSDLSLRLLTYFSLSIFVGLLVMQIAFLWQSYMQLGSPSRYSSLMRNEMRSWSYVDDWRRHVSRKEIRINLTCYVF